MISLVGSTGFVGGNLAACGHFDGLYHSSDIEKAYGTKPDLLIYAGLRAEKFLAEKFPEQDLSGIETAKDNILKIAPKRLVLISTVDVYESSEGKTEEDPAMGQGVYGKNRALLENWVREQYPGSLIVRLPGLFGKGIKKNFIYDYIHFIPALLKPELFEQFSEKEELLKEAYDLNDKGFYALKPLSEEERTLLSEAFNRIGFSALNFTDSRGIFQYYYLKHLYGDIFRALDNNIEVLNITTEPVSVSEIYRFLTGTEFENQISSSVPNYDARSVWFEKWNGIPAEKGAGGYLYRKEQVLEEIKTFTEEER